MFAMSVWVWVYFHIKLKLLGCLNVCMPIGDLNPLERLRKHIHTNLPSVSFTWLQNIQNQWDTTGRLWTSPAAQRHSHPCSFQNAQNKLQELKKQRAYCFNLHLVAAWANTSISQSNQLTISQNQLTALAQRDIEKRDLFQERRNKHTKPYLEKYLGVWIWWLLKLCESDVSKQWLWHVSLTVNLNFENSSSFADFEMTTSQTPPQSGWGSAKWQSSVMLNSNNSHSSSWHSTHNPHSKSTSWSTFFTQLGIRFKHFAICCTMLSRRAFQLLHNLLATGWHGCCPDMKPKRAKTFKA